MQGEKMKCLAGFHIKDCCNQKKCCNNCKYEDCTEGCSKHDKRKTGCVGCPYAVADN